MRITVVGAGYVGLVTAACLADLGHDVWCIDVDPGKIASLQTGTLPIFEPGLGEIVEQNTIAGRLHFSTSHAEAVPDSEVVFVAVGTPAGDDGSVDLTQVRSAIEQIAPHLAGGAIVVMKSTVPVGTTRETAVWLEELRPGLAVTVGANPEFLRQGSAVEDFLEPDRLVIGAAAPEADEALREVYAPLIEAGIPTIFTDLETAELIKYASNSLLAIKLSFINEIADLCEASGASVDAVALGIGLDHRIGPAYLRAGPGFGGSCLPKDIQGLLHTTSRYGTRSHIVAAAVEVNDGRSARMVDKIADALERPIAGSRIALLGVTFKAGTDDVRYSPALDVIAGLVEAGATVRLFDPQGMERAKTVLPPGVEYASDSYDALADADCLVIATEWDEFGALDLERVRDKLRHPLLVDLRNLYQPDQVAASGIRYLSIGRPAA